MKLVKLAVAVTVFAIATASLTIAQDKGKAKGTLPQGWGKLGLSEDQKNKIYDIHAKHNSKIEELEKQIKDIKDKMYKEQAAVLTPEQKAKLKDALESKLGDEKKK